MGETFALLSALFSAFVNVMVKKGTTPSSKENGAFLSIFLTMVTSAVLYVIFGWSRGFPVLNAVGLIWFIIAGIMTSLIGRVLLYASIQHLGPIRASAVKRLNPFFSVLIGVLLLGDTMSTLDIFGMVLIFFGFIILIVPAMKNKNNASKEVAATSSTASANVNRRWKTTLLYLANLGYFYGPISALSYSLGYVARKQGLSQIPDAFFGTMLGASTGVMVYALLSIFKKDYRQSLKTTFTEWHGWLLLAGIFMSLGQIFYFLGLSYTNISTVALLSSMEVILTIFLSIWIFKVREQANYAVYFACILSLVGAVFIVL